MMVATQSSLTAGAHNDLAARRSGYAFEAKGRQIMKRTLLLKTTICLAFLSATPFRFGNQLRRQNMRLTNFPKTIFCLALLLGWGNCAPPAKAQVTEYLFVAIVALPQTVEAHTPRDSY